MAGKTVSFNTIRTLCDSHSEAVAKWLSCNGEVWGVGPTAVFASAAALFLYNELEATVFMPGDQAQVSALEKTLISTMMLGMLALMIHLWVCSMRFIQYYLDTVITDSPSMLLEMTTVGLLGGQPEMMPLGPLTKFLRQQQPQIHITLCWFLSLCYADYVRKHYCQRFNLPYLEQWQIELQDRVVRASRETMERVNCFVGSIHQRLRGYGRTEDQAVPTLGPNNREAVHTVTNDVAGVLAGDAARQPSAPSAPTAPTAPTAQTAPTRIASMPMSERMHVRLVGQSSETTADALEKLRNYIEVVELETSRNVSTSIPSASPPTSLDHDSLPAKILTQHSVHSQQN